jgi:hypothetical protein
MDMIKNIQSLINYYYFLKINTRILKIKIDYRVQISNPYPKSQYFFYGTFIIKNNTQKKIYIRYNIL